LTQAAEQDMPGSRSACLSGRAGFGGLLFETIQSQTCMIFCIAACRREQEEIARSFKKKIAIQRLGLT
jgi:hypothetical protein